MLSIKKNSMWEVLPAIALRAVNFWLIQYLHVGTIVDLMSAISENLFQNRILFDFINLTQVHNFTVSAQYFLPSVDFRYLP